MNIFNEEVKGCWKCSFFHYPEPNTCDTERCMYISKIIMDANLIHPGCPFSKPITKEVIEGFGFVQNHANIDKMYSIFKKTYSVFLCKGDNNYFEISKCHDTIKIRGSAIEWLFRGTINNPEELKFILTAIGVIS